jgi:hypothetical protein
MAPVAPARKMRMTYSLPFIPFDETTRPAVTGLVVGSDK